MLEDFTVEEVEKLHQLYGTPLTDKELMDFYELVGGHPYLVNSLPDTSAKWTYNI